MKSKRTLLPLILLIALKVGLLMDYASAGDGNATIVNNQGIGKTAADDGSSLPGEAITFSVTGDYPYGDEMDILERHIYEHNLYSPSDFFVHVGDLFDESDGCNEQFYEAVAARLRALAVPAFVVIGDNDWTGCSNPAQAFQWWFERFAHFEDNFCRSLVVERQPVRPENWAFVTKGVLFVGINYPGSSAGSAVLQADAEWVDFQFQDKEGQIRAAVVFGHKGPNPTLNLFFERLVASSTALGKPVIYIQGHDHRWQLDKPSDGTPESAWLAPNMQRLIVENGGDEDPVQITVTMDPSNPFEFIRNPWDNNPQPFYRVPCGGFDFLAQKKFKADKHGNSQGNVHSNENIEFRQGLPSTYTGNLTAVNDIKIEEKNTINGNITAGHNLAINSKATVNGTALGHAAVAPVSLPEVSFNAGGADARLHDDEIRDLDPGSYGTVEGGRRSTLKLRSGEYFFKKLNMQDDATLLANVTEGEIMINVVEEVDFHKRARVDITPSGESNSRHVTLRQVKDKDMIFDVDSRFWGSIIAPMAKVRLENNAEFKGSITAKEIEVKENATLLSHSSGLSQAITPEPITETKTGEVVTYAVPSEFSLNQNYPNPFNPETQISFQLPVATHVVMKIYNVHGQEILRLVDRAYAAGTHTVHWEGKDNYGNKVPSGVYFYQLQAGEFFQVKKMSLVK